MRIKRFTAPDMRTALRLVREEQGPDAVILSNRPSSDGVEVVAATDYDEALVHQALRNMATTEAADAQASSLLAKAVAGERVQGRAVFRIDGESAMPATAAAVAVAPVPRERTPSRLEQVMAVLKAPKPAVPAAAPAPVPMAATTRQADFRNDDDIPAVDFAEALRRANPQDTLPAPPPVPAMDSEPPLADIGAHPAPVATPRIDEAPALRAVATDPAVTALRTELSAMRKVIERELGQFAVERMRGAPARAAALDALEAFGLDAPLAQQLAARIDPGLPADAVLPPLRAELAALLPVAEDEPLEAGGVIALLGPTGAGKTTTIAKLAARYAARHRARDVALVSTDGERAGAREQLHVLGRRLGITVCDADSPDALERVLAQLADYPLVLIDTAGHGLRDRALLRQILWMRAASNMRSLLVLPANAHPADLAELLRRYRPAAPEGAILTKLDESVCLGAALSVLIQHELPLAYMTTGQGVPDDLELADGPRLAAFLDLPRRGNTAIPHNDEGHHAFA